MTPFQLDNKTILITGASSGIGRQVAVTVSEMGGKTVITGRNTERLKETFDLLKGKEHRMMTANLTHEEELNELVKNLPLLDGVVHCAGTVHPYPIKFFTEEKINSIFGINYNAQVLLMAGLGRQKKLNKNASIVFMSSISAHHPHKGGALYSGSKSALESFSKVVALEFFLQGVRSNCISAAMVKTPMYDSAAQQTTSEAMEEHISKYPLGVGMPEDVAHAAVFLLSDASRWITGTTLTLDGGFLLGGK